MKDRPTVAYKIVKEISHFEGALSMQRKIPNIAFNRDIRRFWTLVVRKIGMARKRQEELNETAGITIIQAQRN